MIFTILIIGIIFVGGLFYYMNYLAPKFNPLNKADSLLKQNRVHDAIVEFKKLLEKNPRDPLLHFKLSEIYFSQNEVDQAVPHLEAILENNLYNSEVDKLDVLKKLADSYYKQDNIEKAFSAYVDIQRQYPGDFQSLYHVAFITLGQEEFDIAQRYFNRLVKHDSRDFDVMFGAGITSYQNQKFSEAAEYFIEAVALKPNSEIGLLAAAFALMKKKDYKLGLDYADRLAQSALNSDVKFIAKRLYAYMSVLAKKYDQAIKAILEILSYAEEYNMDEEVELLLFDLGYTCVQGEQIRNALDYWNRLYKKNKNYNNIQEMIALLNRELDSSYTSLVDGFNVSVHDYVDDWLKNFFPQNFLWEICGLKNEYDLDVRNILVTARVPISSDDSIKDVGGSIVAGGEKIEGFLALDTENFRIIANRAVGKLGYKVDQILPTYRDSDGVDFSAIIPETKEKVLVWVRRWSKNKIGEITLRNFAQEINDQKARKGLFITTADLTEAAQKTLEQLNKVELIDATQLNTILRGLI